MKRVVQRLEILLRPDALDPLKGKRRSIFFFLAPAQFDSIRHLQAQRWLLTRLIHNQRCSSRPPSSLHLQRQADQS